MDYYSEYSTYDYTTNYGSSSDEVAGLLAAISGGAMLLYWAIMIFVLVCMIKIYTKAGRKWWEAIVPIYNIIVLLEIVELPLWYIALFFVPFANIYAVFKIYIELAHKFGKSTGFGVAMVFFNVICMPILAFGKATYQGGISPMTTYPNQSNVGPQPLYQQPVQSSINPQYNNGSMQPSIEPQSTYQQPVQPTITPQSQYINQPIINNPGVVQPAPSPIVEPPVNMQNQNVKFCPNCGNQVDINNSACPHCGHNC